MTRTTLKTMLLLAGAVGLAACGGSSSDSSNQRPRTIRGAVTASGGGTVTVNGVQMSTGGATVTGRSAGAPIGKGMVVTAKGTFDDRTGAARELEVEHTIEGRVDDKGTDFVVISGQRVGVDDSTEFGEDNPARLGSVEVGDPIAVSGVPDDNGGLRASRIDDSPRAGGSPDDDDDLDVKGFVSNLSAGSFELRLSPDATTYFVVDTSGLAALPAGLGNGAYVEVHAASPATGGAGDLLGTLVATRIEIEDRFGDSEVEVEGIVTTVEGNSFWIDGQKIQWDNGPATRWELGQAGDILPGVKLEAEGSMDSAGVLHAHKISFRPGVRVTAPLQDVSFDGTRGTATILGLEVQIPAHARRDVAPANGQWVELRANPSAVGKKLVALRINTTTENERPQVRGVASSKGEPSSTPSFGILDFFSVTTSAGTEFHLHESEVNIGGAAFHAAVEPGVTVIEARARSIDNVNFATGAFAAEEVEIED